MRYDGNYTLTRPAMLLYHGRQTRTLFFNDGVDEHNLETDALVASGDCFVTLATMLDQLHHNLEESGESVQPELEKVIRTLLYLQRHYAVSRKRPNYRQ